MKHFLTLFALLTTSLAFGQVSCPNLFDSNSNGAVDIEDFLAVLSLFSDVDSDSDGIWDSQDDCIDLEACNYDASPTEPCGFIDVLGECGGGCEGDGDGDGICDDEDDCVGVVDECGVCNGPGPTEVVIEDIVLTYDSVFLPLENDWYVFAVSADTTFGYTCAPACGDPVSYQGYDYATVLIGEQCWFAENLRSENYENGDTIPAELSDNDWANALSGAVTVYDENDSYVEVYGRLYNGYAVNDPRGLCPSGWHVPSDEEWTVLTDHLGGASLAGGHMKSSYGWFEDGNGTDSSGFSGLPGGIRYLMGFFLSDLGYGYWWSSYPEESLGWIRRLTFNTEDVLRYDDLLTNGCSVRCLQDSE